jgi:hypothetical protein
VIVDPERDAAQIRWFHLRQAYIDHRRGMTGCDLGNDLGFSHPGRTPEHHWRMVPFTGTQKFSIKYSLKLRRTHGFSVS